MHVELETTTQIWQMRQKSTHLMGSDGTIETFCPGGQCKSIHITLFSKQEKANTYWQFSEEEN